MSYIERPYLQRKKKQTQNGKINEINSTVSWMDIGQRGGYKRTLLDCLECADLCGAFKGNADKSLLSRRLSLAKGEVGKCRIFRGLKHLMLWS